jgi:hypothetical protein
MLTGTITAQSLEAITWRHSKVIETYRCIEQLQFPPGNTLDCAEPPHVDVDEQALRVPISKALYHASR